MISLLLFPDGTQASRVAQWTRTWLRAENPMEDVVEVYGYANGISREGIEYTVTVDEEDPLIYKRVCQMNQIRIAVQGAKTFTYGTEEAVVNYGDGNCDNVVEMNRNGKTEQREINIRRRFGN